MEKLRPLLHKRKAKPTQPTSQSRRFLPPVVGSKQWLVESTNTAEQMRRTQQPFRSVPQPPVKPMYGVERARLLNPIRVEQPPDSNADFSFSFTGQRAERERKLRDSSMFDIDEQQFMSGDELSNTEAHQYQKIHNAERIIKRGQKGVRFYITDDNQSISSAGSLGSVDEYTPESPRSLASLYTPTPEPPATPPQPRVNHNRMRNHETHSTVGSTKRVQNDVTFYVTDDEQSISSTGSLDSVAVYTPESPRSLPSQNTPTPEPAAALFKPAIYRSRMRNQETHNAKRSIQSGQNGVTFYVTDDEQSISSTESLGSVDVYTPESQQALPALRTFIPKPPSTPPQPGMKTNRMRKLKTHSTVGSTKRVQNDVTFYVTDDEQSISSTGSLDSVAVYTPESPRSLPSQNTPTPEPAATLFKPTINRSRMRNQETHNARRSMQSGQNGVTFYVTDDEQSISSTESLGSVDVYTPESPQALPALRTFIPKPPSTPPQPGIKTNRMRNHKTHSTVGSTKRVQNDVTFYVTDDEQSISSTGSLDSVAVYTPESPRSLPSQNTPTPEPPAAALFKPTINRSRMRNQETHNVRRRIQSGQNGVTFYVTDDEQSISSTESLGSVDVYTPESPQALPALRTFIPKPPSTPPQPGMKTNRMRNHKTHSTVGSTKRVQNDVTFYVTDDEQSISSTGSLDSVAVYTPESPRSLPSQNTPTPEPAAALFKPTINRSRMRNQETHKAVGTIKRGQKSMRLNIPEDEQSIHSTESLGSVDVYTPESPQALPALRTLTPEPPAAPPQPWMKTNRMRKQDTHNTVGSTKSVQKGVTFYVNFDEESGNSAGNQGTVGACSPVSPQARPARRTPTPEPPAAPFKPRVTRTRMGNQPGSSQGRNVAVNTRVNKPREQQTEQLKEQSLSREQPECVLAQAFKLLSDGEWEQKVEGLQCIRTLAEHHKDIVMPQLHDLAPMLTKEVKNLRSAVSRAAMATLGHLYAHLNKSMDQYVRSTAGVLLHKAGEANKFIREEVELALGNMVQNCSPGPVHNALLDTGLTHRSVAVRRCAALGLEKLAELMGPAQVLTDKSELTGNFLSGISKLALDPAQEVRSHARKVLKLLATQQNFMKMVEKFVPQRDKASIKDIVSK